jgi:hypothetical protein
VHILDGLLWLALAEVEDALAVLQVALAGDLVGVTAEDGLAARPRGSAPRSSVEVLREPASLGAKEAQA